MSISVVRNHLISTLKSAQPALKVVEENENFAPTSISEYPYCFFSLNPRESELVDIDTTLGQREFGLTSIQLYFSRATNTLDEALQMAEQIQQSFPVQNLELDGNNQFFVSASWIEAPEAETTRFGIPIFIRWLNQT